MIHYYFLLVLILLVSLLAHHLLLTVWNRRKNGEIIYDKQTAKTLRSRFAWAAYYKWRRRTADRPTTGINRTIRDGATGRTDSFLT